MNNDKDVRKVLKRLRKMSWWQRIIVMEWLNDWYAYEKHCHEEIRKLEEEE
mgnify:CR=1 FL=1